MLKTICQDATAYNLHLSFFHPPLPSFNSYPHPLKIKILHKYKKDNFPCLIMGIEQSFNRYLASRQTVHRIFTKSIWKVTIFILHLNHWIKWKHTNKLKNIIQLYVRLWTIINLEWQGGQQTKRCIIIWRNSNRR